MKHILSSLLLAISVGLSLQAPAGDVTTFDKTKLLQLGAANDEFETRLLSALEADAAGKKNVFISGFSMSSALSMLMVGGVNQTYNEIHQTLGFDKSHFSTGDILTSYQHLMGHLNGPAVKGSGNIVSVANAVAIQKNEPILESYLNSITTYFGAQVFAEDFRLNGQAATDELNHWVNDRTHGKIPKLFEKLDPDTIMVLMNAIYFKGVWEYKFDEKNTKNEQFHVSAEQSESVPFMMQRGKLGYARLDDGQLLEIPYKNKTMSMYIVLPNQGANRQVSSMLASHSLEQLIQQKASHDVIVHLPKFKFDSSYSMKKTLQTLGIKAAFNGADFSNINGHHDLAVSEVIHKTFIDVNEEGSEAAAATGVVIVRTSAIEPPPRPIEFRVDRPFAFFIRDNEQQLTLFSGIINKPEYKK